MASVDDERVWVEDDLVILESIGLFAKRLRDKTVENTRVKNKAVLRLPSLFFLMASRKTWR